MFERWHIAEVAHHAMRGLARVTGGPTAHDWENTSTENREAMMAAVADPQHPLVKAVVQAMGEMDKEEESDAPEPKASVKPDAADPKAPTKGKTDG